MAELKNSPESDGSVQGTLRSSAKRIILSGYRCPWWRRHFSSTGTRNQVETTKGQLTAQTQLFDNLMQKFLPLWPKKKSRGEIERADLLEENVQLAIAIAKNRIRLNLLRKVMC